MTAPEVHNRTLATNGVELNLLEAGSGPPVILAHGFPELAYSWRHQIPALAERGYRVVAPDQRGYGRSSRPEPVEAYDILQLTGDLLGVLDDLGSEKAVFVGHDWGSMVVWQMALLHPDRVAGVVGMSVAFGPRGSEPPVPRMRQAMGESFYIVHFQEPGVADAELGADPARTMRSVLTGNPDESAPLPSWLTQEELDVYAAEFTRTGFTGGINWYRNLDRNWEITPQLAGAKVEVPSLFIGGRDDFVLTMAPPERSEPFLSDHRGTVVLDGAGHWVQQEKPAEVNAALIRFLESLGDWS